MKPVKPDVHFPTLEKNILDFWKRNEIVHKGLSANQGKERFVFYDGPPFATGLPHYGNILPGTLKDVVPRYWVMKGKYVERRWGWDCHGLPVEFEMENSLGLSGTPDIEKYGIANFNEACRSNVLKYTKEWEEIICRTGRWADFQNSYRTMDTPFMESVWWVFKQLWDKGLIFEGYRVMHYSWRVSTPLSNFESGLNYKEVQDPAITVRFKSDRSNRYFLAWTTTPWTLPSNLALAIHPEGNYVEIEDLATGDHYVLMVDRLVAYYKSPSEYRIVAEFSGKQLEGETYEPLFPYFIERKKEGAYRVVLADYVSAVEGTGIVHTAPAFGEEDFEICKQYGIALVDPVDPQGNFTDRVADFKGLNVKEADKEIIKYLKSKKAVVRHETIIHNYPYCWRSETPLIFKAISTWFVKLGPLKEALVTNNTLTHWVPEHLRDGRFGKWLESAKDWNISRNRFWGTPLPIWRCEKHCGGVVCVGSIDDLERLGATRPKDIHKHFVDEITIQCPKCKKPMKRIPEVLDCWFESGAMPYGQAHYPFENKEIFEKTFPADFIAEGLDQTRGWFYTLSVLSTALFDKPPFKHVIVNGLVLAKDGKKMSKRLKNYPEVTQILESYGADALRAYLMNSPASHAEEARFSENGVKEVIRTVLLPFWNAYSFLVTYATADGWDPKTFDTSQLDRLENDLDRWILSRLETLIQRVDGQMAIYHLYEIVPDILNFIDELTNWYIRLNRRRFWEESRDKAGSTKEMAYSTLYFVILDFCKVLAPFLPFITEEIYQNLRSEKDGAQSVHLCEFPKCKKEWIRRDLESRMELVRTVVGLGRTCRNIHKLKVRQPLRELLVITKTPEDKATIDAHRELISGELNVKKVSFSSEETKWVNLSVLPNLKVLGPRLGQKMKLIARKIKELGPEKVLILESRGSLEIEGETIRMGEVLLQRQPKAKAAIVSAGNISVLLDTALDDALVKEGVAREIVNRIQKLRKEMDLQVTDRILVYYHGTTELKAAIDLHRDYIASETLAEKLEEGGNATCTSEHDIDGMVLKLRIGLV